MSANPSPPPRRWLIPTVALAGLVLAAIGLWSWPALRSFAGRGGSATRAAAANVAYVKNDLCVSCHEPEARAWVRSNHAHAMAVPTDSSLHGDFGGVEFQRDGVTTRFFMREGKYRVRTDGPDGKPAVFDVAYTFGEEPLQQLLIAMPGGRLQPLQVAWDRVKSRWFRLLPEEKMPAGDVLHWTGRYQTANTMCLSCHTTGYEKRYAADADTFDSRWVETSVTCQSCHGPGELHVRWARRHPRALGTRAAGDTDMGRLGLVADTRHADPRRRIEICAPCHSRRSEITAAAVPGEPFLDHHLPSLLEPGRYHADGQQLDEVFEDGSYRQSRMYQKGVTCTDCHEPHGGKLRLTGNDLCLQCHGTQPNAAFPKAAGSFATPAHHFHAQGSEGSQCVACHMPAKDYMVVQSRRDHSIRVPRPDLSVKLGTPNACNGCHADRTAQWAADRSAEWWGRARRERPHYAEALAAGRAGGAGAAEALSTLVSSDTLPGIVRATALDALRGDAGTAIDARVAATRDPDAEVRAAATTSLEAAPADVRLRALAPLLADPIRAVRIGAARVLSTLPATSFETAARQRFSAALAEYAAAQQASLDMPGARLNLAVLHENLGEPALAEREYLAALRIDPDFTPARANLSRLYNATSRNADAIRVLQEGLTRLPGIGELWYSLGLLLAEENRLDEAAEALIRATRLLPDRPRIHYNLGLMQQQLGRSAAAEAELLAAVRLAPNDPDVLHALTVLYAQNGKAERARAWMAKLRELQPFNPDWVRLEESLGH
jgi:predicted CXXCH cytochrome family protein